MPSFLAVDPLEVSNFCSNSDGQVHNGENSFFKLFLFLFLNLFQFS